MKKKQIKKQRKKRVLQPYKWFAIAMCMVSIFAVAIESWKSTAPAESNMEYTEFIELLEEGKIEQAELVSSEDIVVIHTTDGENYNIINPKYEDFRKELLENGVKMKVRTSTPLDAITSILVSMPTVIILCLLGYFIFAQLNNMNGNMFKIYDSENAITFDNIAGMKGIKEEVKFAVDTLVNYNRITQVGGRPVKGIILEGPPGTGKTMIARAIAGEAKVPFISVSGADFIEMFVGLGAARVRSLWQLARENAPCVVFIDEIDAVGMSRVSGGSAGLRESNQTLNALLQRMDGVEGNRGILVIGATNRIDDLDSALLRPGRFDKKIHIGPPSNKEDRDDIIKIHLNGKYVCDEPDFFENVSKSMFGLTGAEIESVINESILISIADDRDGTISYKDIDKAVMKLKLNGVIGSHSTERDRKVTAIHEAGHALIAALNGMEVAKVSVTPYTSGVGGVTVLNSDQLKDNLRFSSEFKKEIKYLLGGIGAERVVYGENTNGASSDLERAIQLVREMKFKWGMDSEGINVSTKSMYDSGDSNEANEIKNTVNEILESVMFELRTNKDELIRLSDELLDKEQVYNYKLDNLCKD